MSIGSWKLNFIKNYVYINYLENVILKITLIVYCLWTFLYFLGSYYIQQLAYSKIPVVLWQPGVYVSSQGHYYPCCLSLWYVWQSIPVWKEFLVLTHENKQIIETTSKCVLGFRKKGHFAIPDLLVTDMMTFTVAQLF